MANYEREVAIGSILASSVSFDHRPSISVTTNDVFQDKGYTLYKVFGKDFDGDFEVHRRYKDFTNLRAWLVKYWPGCYIPQIPGKCKIVRFI